MSRHRKMLAPVDRREKERTARAARFGLGPLYSRSRRVGTKKRLPEGASPELLDSEAGWCAPPCPRTSLIAQFRQRPS